MRLVAAGDVDVALPWPLLIAELRRAFAGGVASPPRHRHDIADGKAPLATLLLMPAWTDALIGVKSVTIHPGNAAMGLPAVPGAYLLSRTATGEVLAAIDAHALTSRRTAGVAALGADLLARHAASRLLIVGAGAIAALLPGAMASVRPIEDIAVWSRRRESAESLCAELRGQGHRAVIADSLEAAAREADIVSCATLSTEPLIEGSWLAPGSHLDLIGSFRPDMRECDTACFAGSQLFVDTHGAFAESGELMAAQARGVLGPEHLTGTLAGLCAGMVVRDPDPLRRTVFKSVGTAVADFAAAVAVWQALGEDPM